MNKKNWILAGVLILACVFSGLFVTACSDDSEKPGKTTYTIKKVANFDNSKGDFSISPASAKAGDTITLMITAIEDDYIVDAITIAGASPAPTVTTVTKDAQYTFHRSKALKFLH